ncbi:hypothetical protein [Geomonas edaphica]|uniref:hypothetical protein n=1 Tax=Geomonas edaphica TaxID=2570226 RepID=UPI0010A7FC1B|nr:hypothetical protein [Geomonas edaphica]
MLNINATDRVIVIEQNSVKLDAAVRLALDEAREVLRSHYLLKTQPNDSRKGAHSLYHILLPPANVCFLPDYIKLLDDILCRHCRERIPVEEISGVAFGSPGKISRWRSNTSFKIVFRHALKAVFVSLLRQRAVLLPPNIDRYMPLGCETTRGFKLMPDRLREMAAVLYAGTGLDYGVDWSHCTYSWNGKTLNESGIENFPSRDTKTALVHLAMSTRWDSIEEVDPIDIGDFLIKSKRKFTVGLYLTYLYLKSSKDELIKEKVFGWVEKIPSLRIYTLEFELYAKKAKARRSTAKISELGLKRDAYLASRSDVDRRPFEERILEPIMETTKGGAVDAVSLARCLGRMSGRTRLAPTNNWPTNSVLPEWISFDWVNQTADWLAGFNVYARMMNYANVESEFNAFVPFMHYLTVYLPIYFHYNPDSDATYPSKIQLLNGFHFISRPFDIHQKLPLPFVTFVREYYNEASQERTYTAIRKLHQFFKVIMARRELLAIPDSFINPVLECDIPCSGGRPTKTTKTRLPRKAYWLSLLYAYKVYDYVAAINQKCLDNSLYAELYSVRFHNLEKDDFGLIDIRDILDDDVDRRVKFEGVEYDVNLVPSYFLFPIDLPLKGKGHRYMIRPHAITHLICTLETGIRNQHIQWLSCDFDKNIQAGNINTEDVYQLFVLTDKSNRSWTALTSGRVIKVLREMRIFRNLIEAKSFDDKIYYEGRNKSAYPSFKALFAFNIENGSPYSDIVYEAGFRHLLAGVQPALNHYCVEFNLFEVEDGDILRRRIKPKLSPHSMRVTVVSEYVQFLNSEYVGRYLTNQKLATVWYYTKFDAEALQKMQADQRRGISQFNRRNSEVSLIGDGGTAIDATDPNSALSKAFKENPDQAITDFGAVSSHFFDRETGIGIVTSNSRVALAFEPTHICPYNRICPADRHKDGFANRCNFCDYAIRTVEHLPALGCRRRDLIEELERIEGYQEAYADKLTQGQDRDLDERISVIAEDLGSLDLAEKILHENLRRLNCGEEAHVMVYMPEAILKNLEAVPFPDSQDEARYLLARLVETELMPDDTRHLLKMKLLNLSYDIRANTGNIRQILKRGGKISHIEANVFSLVNSLKTAYGLTLDQIAEIATRDVGEMVQLDHQTTTALALDEVSASSVFPS